MLTRLIYASTATVPVDPDVVADILNAASVFNAQQGITGLLCEGSGKFMQYIEGHPESIHTLYERLQKDVRHKNLVILEQSPIHSRAYDDWSMGFVSARNADIQRLVHKVTGETQFAPENLVGKQALDLIDNFKAQLYPQVSFTLEDTALQAKKSTH